jgi:uncharacterized protein (TIGR02001 family)
VVAVALAAPGLASAQDPVSSVSGYVTLASGYWKHGVAQTEGASLQLGVDYQHHTGFFAYARAMNVDYPSDYWHEADVEASAYVGFHDRRDRWSWTASIGRYIYPDTSGAYDYDELSFSIGFRDRVFYALSYNDEYYGYSSEAVNQEVSVVFPLRGDFEIGGALGYFDVADSGPEITHWNLGVSKLLRSFALDLRYYDGDYETTRNYLGDADGDHVVLSASYQVRGRRAGSRR